MGFIAPSSAWSNSALNPTQETRTQTGILYKDWTFFKKKPKPLKNGHTDIFTALYFYLKSMFKEIIPGHDMNQCILLTLFVDPKKQNYITFWILFLLTFAELMTADFLKPH